MCSNWIETSRVLPDYWKDKHDEMVSSRGNSLLVPPPPSEAMLMKFSLEDVGIAIATSSCADSSSITSCAVRSWAITRTLN